MYTLQSLLYKDLNKRDNRFSEVLFDPEHSCIKYPSIFEPVKTSDNVKKGNRLGRFIFYMFLLPVMPRLFGCFWTCIQLMVALILLILSLISITQLSGIFVSLSITVSVTIAVFSTVDALFFIHGCCTSTRISTSRFLPDSWFTKYYRAYEITRTIASEILLYPLIILCLFELLDSSVFNLALFEHKIIFGIFVFSSIYTIMFVYIVRPLMIIVTIARLRSIAPDVSDYIKFFVRFLLHVVAQVLVHILCVAAVAVRIHLENISSAPGSYVASPFLWIAMVCGWVIPIMGTLSFLILNYYWLQHLYLCQFLHVVEYIERPEYIKAVYLSDTYNSSFDQSRATQFLKNAQYHSIKKQYTSERRQTNIAAKVVYPAKVLPFLLYGLCFDLAYGGFIIGLYTSVNFTSASGLITFVAIFLVGIINVPFLLFINIWLLIIVLVVLLLLIFSPVLIVICIVRKCKPVQVGYSRQI